MKKIRLISIVIAIALLVGAVIGITAAAENSPSVEIFKKNVSYDESLELVYAIKAENAEGYEVKLLVSDKAITAPESIATPEGYTVNDATATITLGGVSYPVAFSGGINAKEMRKPVYALPVLVEGDTVVASGEAVVFSIYDYAMARFDGSATPEQYALYTALLDYGAAVQAVLCSDEEIDAYGWADAYYNVSTQLAVDGAVIDGTLVAGELSRPSDGKQALKADHEYATADGEKLFDGFYLGEEQVYEFGKEKTANGWTEYTAKPGTHTYTFNYRTSAYHGGFEDYNDEYDYETVTTVHGKNNVLLSNTSGVRVATATKEVVTRAADEEAGLEKLYYKYLHNNAIDIAGGHLTSNRNGVIVESNDPDYPVGSYVQNKNSGVTVTVNPKNGSDTTSKNVTRHVISTDFFVESTMDSVSAIGQWRIARSDTGLGMFGMTVYADRDANSVVFCLDSHNKSLNGVLVAGYASEEKKTDGFAALDEWNNLTMEYIGSGKDAYVKIYLNGVLCGTYGQDYFYNSTNHLDGIDKDFVFTVGYFSSSTASIVKLDNTFTATEWDGEVEKSELIYGDVSNTLTYDDQTDGYKNFTVKTAQTFYPTEGNTTGTKFVAEADFRWNGVLENAGSPADWHLTPIFYAHYEANTTATNVANDNSRPIFLGSLDHADLYPQLFITNSKHYSICDSQGNFTSNIMAAVIEPGVWYSLRFEITQTENSNGKYTRTFTTYLNGVEVRSTNVTAEATVVFTELDYFYWQVRGEISFDMDNVFVGAIPETADESVAQNGNGSYAGESFDGDVLLPEGTTAVIEKTAEGENNVITVSGNADSATSVTLSAGALSGTKYTYELDMKYVGNAIEGNKVFGLDMLGSNGAVLPIVANSTEKGIVLKLGSETLTELLSNVWYTVKLEYSAGSDENGYLGYYILTVNGAAVASGYYTASPEADNSSYNGVTLTVEAGMGRILKLDNTYVGSYVGEYSNKESAVKDIQTYAKDFGLVPVTTEATKLFVFETDIRWTSLQKGGDSWIIYWSIMSASRIHHSDYRPALLYGSDDTLNYNAGHATRATYAPLKKNVWYNIRTEIEYVLNEDGATYTQYLRLYVDGEMFYSRVEASAVAEADLPATFEKVSFDLRTNKSHALTLEMKNCYVGNGN